jgi:hypothetical protein
MREWYEAKGIDYDSIDLSGEDGCIVKDLSVVQKWESNTISLLTSGRVSMLATTITAGSINGICAKVGGVIISENPKKGKLAGTWVSLYRTKEFYNIAASHESKRSRITANTQQWGM